METAEIIALLQIAAVLEPQAVQLTQNLITAIKGTGSTSDKMKQLIDLQGGLKPMEILP